jgi:hypothetical protein
MGSAGSRSPYLADEGSAPRRSAGKYQGALGCPPRFVYKGGKEAEPPPVIQVEVLRMALHGHDESGFGELDCFHGPIFSSRRNREPRGELVHRLMVHAVCRNPVGAKRRRKPGIPVDCQVVNCHGELGHRSPVILAARTLHTEILHQGAAPGHVNQLDSTAYAKYRDGGVHGKFGKGEFRHVSFFVNRFTTWVHILTIAAGMNIYTACE